MAQPIFEDDYPTGPIEDMWPLLAEGHVVDVNGAHHGRDGKFVPKIVPPVEDAPVERSSYVPVPVSRCPHGSFMRWAKSNCCKKGRT